MKPCWYGQFDLGMDMVNVDLLSMKIIDINVWNPCCLQDTNL
jgi:hypothetical protein